MALGKTIYAKSRRILALFFIVGITLLFLDFTGSIHAYIVWHRYSFGNIVLPQFCHLFPHGGAIWLPIYFFTLIGAYKYGWRVGLITALASPLVNSVLFGMPVVAALPSIILKSVILAVCAGFIASKYKKTTVWMLSTPDFVTLGLF